MCGILVRELREGGREERREGGREERREGGREERREGWQACVLSNIQDISKVRPVL